MWVAGIWNCQENWLNFIDAENLTLEGIDYLSKKLI